ncbi:D-alanyl-D-alanine carboxypeptidase family protein [Oscillospiraceae bacterium LTW-04]|nr:D-alanyl-D-alanine carboxypeptidase family protein [Oscillospiraceae bacterium MB24-C1]
MKFVTGLLSALLTSAMLVQFCTAAAPPAVNSETYVVMDVKSGQVLAAKGAHTQMYPASITKILTCALALQNGSPQDIHTMSYEATHSIDYGSTHIALTEEEQVSVEALLNATMVESANDAANGLAEYTAGGLDAFADLMNQKAAELGAKDSHFVNAHGLHDKNHYTSAYDMALLTRWALTVNGFRALFGAEEYTIPPTNKQKQSRTFGTHHHMLVESKYYYEGTEGGKLGWTPEAQHTLVTLAKRGNMELICVVMKTRTQYEKYVDAAKLLDYCFDEFSTATMTVNQYEKTPIAVYDGDVQTGKVLIPSQDIDIIRPPTVAKIDITSELVAPESYKAGDTIDPRIKFFDPDGNELGEVALEWTLDEVPVEAAATTVEPSGTPVSSSRISPGFWLKALAAVFVASVLVLFAIRRHNLRMLEQKRLLKARKKQEWERQRREALGTARAARSSYAQRRL